MSFAVRQIDHVEVFVTNLASAKEWYWRVLGLHETARWHPEPVMLGAGGTSIALFLGEASHAILGERTGWHRVAWSTDAKGFQAAQAHLKSLGIVYRGPVDHGSAESIYFTDPDGNPLEITHNR